MTAIHETAYPRLKSNPSQDDLVRVYTPSTEELKLVRRNTKSRKNELFFLISLKTFQRLGYFVPLKEVPDKIIKHLGNYLRTEWDEKDVAKYDTASSRPRHIKFIRETLGTTSINMKTLQILKETLVEAAQTKEQLPDIINIGIEVMSQHRFELPAFSTLLKEAKSARANVNKRLFASVAKLLSNDAAKMVDEILAENGGHKSTWGQIKQEPHRPTVSNVRDYIKHVSWLKQLALGLPTQFNLPAAKSKQFLYEARALNVASMRELADDKRYALTALFIQSQAGKSVDDVADIFIKIVQKLHYSANEALKEHQLSQSKNTDGLLELLQNVIEAYQSPGTKTQRFDLMEAVLLGGDPEAILSRCTKLLAYANNNYLPFLLPLYTSKRAVLLDCLENLNLISTTQDKSTLKALQFLLRHRHSRKPHLNPYDEDGNPLDLNWIPEKWLKLVTGKTVKQTNLVSVHRKYFELCLFTCIAQALKSADLVVVGSEKYSDYRDQLVDEDTYNEQVDDYCEMVGISSEPTRFTDNLKDKLSNIAKHTDVQFPENDQVRIINGEPMIQRIKRKPIPAAMDRINKALDDRLVETSILDVLVYIEKWLGLSTIFRPLSGHASKLTDHQKRFVITAFCYGCNLGPTQTSRSIEGFNRKQIAWLNIRHSTEEKLEDAIRKIINVYNEFALPGHWGTGQTASADGTKWDLYEQNLISEYHLRYLSAGGIGYYHLSDKYIALFSHFIPCGVYEAIYILDGLLKNESDIQPDTIHGDTHSQSEAVFGLAYLLGIKLMPRIKGIKKLTFYRPQKGQQYKHIDDLFSDSIKWELIETYLPDMLRIAVSIKCGRVHASTILRILGTYSRKNKLYLALRELGRVARTAFLLEYIANAKIRETIHSATCKSEEFNDFLQWVMFGNHGLIAENIRHEQQKIIKYNHLVANMIILFNVISMTKVLNELSEEGMEISKEVLAGFSPFRRHYINRFGMYPVNMNRKLKKIEYDVKIKSP